MDLPNQKKQRKKKIEIEKVERLIAEQCPVCAHSLTLGMLCFPKCKHKICLKCAYKTVRCFKPYGEIIFSDLIIEAKLCYSSPTIQCPLCRENQTSCFSTLEPKLLNGFLYPRATGKMQCRIESRMLKTLTMKRKACGNKCII